MVYLVIVNFVKGEQIMYEIFEQLMQKKGVTAYRVSKDTGISTATLTDWKMGRSTPKNDKLQRIADYFGVTLDYLTGREKDLSLSLTFTSEQGEQIFIDIVKSIEKLNNEGAKAAERYMRYLASLKEYENNDNSSILNAAHKRTDKTVTEEDMKHDDDIMDDPNF